MIKDAIEIYFDKLCKLWMKRRNTKPLVPFDDKMPNFMYEGERNKNNYIVWKLMPITRVVDFQKIEQKLEFDLREEIKQYFSNYFFLNMAGEYNGINLNFTPITPLTNIEWFILRRNEIAIQMGRDNFNIELGYAEIDGIDDILLCIDNRSGKVVLIDVEKTTIDIISPSLDILIRNMEARC